LLESLLARENASTRAHRPVGPLRFRFHEDESDEASR